MKWLAELLRGIADTIDPPAAFPTFTEYPLSGNDVAALCMGAHDHVYIWDNQYWVLTLEDWQKVFKDVLVGIPMYLAEKFDCEDFAFACMTRVTEKYQINCCGVAVGNSPMGYHGFNLFIAKHDDGFKLHTLEPQNGTIDPPSYVPDTVIFG